MITLIGAILVAGVPGNVILQHSEDVGVLSANIEIACMARREMPWLDEKMYALYRDMRYMEARLDNRDTAERIGNIRRVLLATSRPCDLPDPLMRYYALLIQLVEDDLVPVPD